MAQLAELTEEQLAALRATRSSSLAGHSLYLNFVSGAEEEVLLKWFDEEASKKEKTEMSWSPNQKYDFCYYGNQIRRASISGARCDEIVKGSQPMSKAPLLMQLLERMQKLHGLQGFSPQQAQIIAYDGSPEAKLAVPACAPHTDRPIYGEPIVSLSLGAGTTMTFKAAYGSKEVPVQLPARSLQVLTGDARSYKWRHGINQEDLAHLPALLKPGRPYGRLSITWRPAPLTQQGQQQGKGKQARGKKQQQQGQGQQKGNGKQQGRGKQQQQGQQQVDVEGQQQSSQGKKQAPQKRKQAAAAQTAGKKAKPLPSGQRTLDQFAVKKPGQ